MDMRTTGRETNRPRSARPNVTDLRRAYFAQAGDIARRYGVDFDQILDEAGESPQVLRAALDLDALRSWRAEFPMLRDVRPELLGSMIIDKSIQHQVARQTAS